MMASKGILETAIKFIAKNLSLPECKDVCRELKITNVHIDTITNENPNDVQSQKFCMLKKWQDKAGSEATLEILEETLEYCDYRRVLEPLHDHLRKRGYPLPVPREDGSQAHGQEVGVNQSASVTPASVPSQSYPTACHGPVSNVGDEVHAAGSASTVPGNAPKATNGEQLVKKDGEVSIPQSSSVTNTGHSGPSHCQESVDSNTNIPVSTRGAVEDSQLLNRNLQVMELMRPIGDNVDSAEVTEYVEGGRLAPDALLTHKAKVSQPTLVSTALATQNNTETPTISGQSGTDSLCYPLEETPGTPTDPLKQLKDLKLGHRLQIFTREEINRISGQLEDRIGEGSFGDTYKGCMELAGISRNVAIKEIKLHILTDQGTSNFKQRCVANVRHPYIVPVIGVCEEPSISLCVVYSYMEKGNLEQVLKRLSKEDIKTFPDDTLDLKKSLVIISQISSALTYLHSQSPPIIHLDVKPANILLDSSFNARLGDVGFDKNSQDWDIDSPKFPITSFPGTPGYQDISMLGNWSLRAENDVFSLGVVMLRMLTGEPALVHGRKPPLSLHARLREEGYFKDANEIIKKAIQHIWLSNGNGSHAQRFAELMLKCLKLAPEERISMESLHEQTEGLAKEVGCLLYSETAMDDTLKKLCVMCHTNPRVWDLHLISKECNDTCDVACVQCLIDSRKNPLVCPKHGAAQPPIGHSKSFAIFIGADDKFNMDAEELYAVFTDPNIGAIWEENAVLLTSKADERFKSTRANILEQLRNIKEKMEGEDEDEASLMFYFSGHGSGKGAHLFCSGEEELKASDLRSEIHGMKFTQLLIILDCCHAAKNGPLQVGLLNVIGPGNDVILKSDGEDQNDDNILEDNDIPVLYKAQGSNAFEKRSPNLSPNYSIIQWSSSMYDQKSLGYEKGHSLFTSHIISGLRAAERCQLRKTDSCGQPGKCQFCPKYKNKMHSQSYITFFELNKYVYDHVREQMSRHPNHDQIPHVVAKENVRVNRIIAYCKANVK